MAAQLIEWWASTLAYRLLAAVTALRVLAEVTNVNVATYQITGSLVSKSFQEGAIMGTDFNERMKVTEGFPEGAIIRDIRFRPSITTGTDNGLLELLVEHESFEELGEADDMWGNLKMIVVENETLPSDACTCGVL